MIMALIATDFPEPVDPGDENVRHAGEIGSDDAAIDVFAKSDGEPRLALREALALDYVAEPDGLALGVRDLDADGALAGHAFDEDGFGGHGEAEIVGETGDAGDLDAGLGAELEGGDDGAGIDLRDLAVDGELRAFFDEHAGLFAQGLLAHDGLLVTDGAVKRAGACSRARSWGRW